LHASNNGAFFAELSLRSRFEAGRGFLAAFRCNRVIGKPRCRGSLTFLALLNAARPLNKSIGVGADDCLDLCAGHLLHAVLGCALQVDTVCESFEVTRRSLAELLLSRRALFPRRAAEGTNEIQRTMIAQQLIERNRV
jgi:hypothetical protein